MPATNHTMNLRADRAYLVNIWRFGNLPAIEPALTADRHYTRIMVQAVGRDDSSMRIAMQMSTTQMSDQQHVIDCITLAVAEGEVVEPETSRQLIQYHIGQPAGPVPGGSGTITLFEGEGETRGTFMRNLPMGAEWRRLALTTDRRLIRQQMLVPSGRRFGPLWTQYHVYVEVHELIPGVDVKQIRKQRGPHFVEQEEAPGGAGSSSGIELEETAERSFEEEEAAWEAEQLELAAQERAEGRVEGKDKGKGKGILQGTVLPRAEAVAAGFRAEKTTTTAEKGKAKKTVAQKVTQAGTQRVAQTEAAGACGQH
ncbi:hypothetical protein HDU88_003989 [Geranomyces variabilis]|nr:hypothetical protein HDU88_003989 [Geranomyces variabilis]